MSTKRRAISAGVALDMVPFTGGAAAAVPDPWVTDGCAAVKRAGSARSDGQPIDAAAYAQVRYVTVTKH